MKIARRELFTGSCLTLKEHSGVGSRYSIEELKETLERW